jgi:23S rRNA pseudouridine1911/1915/1917 synthase
MNTSIEQKTFTYSGDKTRLDLAMAARYPEISRSRMQRDIESGLVSVNDAVAIEAKQAIRDGDMVTYEYQAVKPSAAIGMDIPILFENDDFMIVDKPIDLPVHPAPGYNGTTLAEELVLKYPGIVGIGEDPIRPGIVHRLDKDTSGAMIVAKTQPIFEYLKESFATRKINKIYTALLVGRLSQQHGFWNAPIGRHPTDFRKMTANAPKEPKESSTEFFTTQHFRGEVDEYTQIKVKLHTGRTHQIRVHAQTAGYPVVGDQLYGKRASDIPGLTRQFLHASSLEVQLPDGSWIEANSPLPQDLQHVLQSLEAIT